MSTDVLKLTRVSVYHGGIYGVLTFNQEPFCITKEYYNIVSKPHKYFCERYANTWKIKDNNIYFHLANVFDENVSIITLGDSFDELEYTNVFNTKSKAFINFMKITKSTTELKLIIQEAF